MCMSAKRQMRTDNKKKKKNKATSDAVINYLYMV